MSSDPEKPTGCDERDYARWRNCLERDFTINGSLIYPCLLDVIETSVPHNFTFFCFPLFFSFTFCHVDSSFACPKIHLFCGHFDGKCDLFDAFKFRFNYLVVDLISFSFKRRLMFDPYAKLVYDYMGGVNDIRKAKVCMYL